MKALKAILGVVLFIVACLLTPFAFSVFVAVGATLAASLPIIGVIGIILIPGIIIGILIAKK